MRLLTMPVTVGCCQSRGPWSSLIIWILIVWTSIILYYIYSVGVWVCCLRCKVARQYLYYQHGALSAARWVRAVGEETRAGRRPGHATGGSSHIARSGLTGVQTGTSPSLRRLCWDSGGEQGSEVKWDIEWEEEIMWPSGGEMTGSCIHNTTAAQHRITAAQSEIISSPSTRTSAGDWADLIVITEQSSSAVLMIMLSSH